ARGAQRDLEKNVSIEAGGAVSVTLAEPASDGADATPTPPSPPPARDTAPAPSSGWSPWVVAAGSGITLVLTGLTIWSGVETVNSAHAFDGAPSQAALDSGRAQQTRTNVLLASAIGVGVLTGVAGVWLVDWKGRNSGRVGFGLAPGGAAAR